RQNQTDDRSSAAADLSAPHRHGHCKAADDKDGGVDGAERYIEVVTGANESCRILRAIKRVSEEHATEEHDFGDEKHPHPERARFALLLHVFKMVLQRGMVRRVLVSCDDSFRHLMERRHPCLRFAGIYAGALTHPLTRMVLTSCFS